MSDEKSKQQLELEAAMQEMLGSDAIQQAQAMAMEQLQSMDMDAMMQQAMGSFDMNSFQEDMTNLIGELTEGIEVLSLPQLEEAYQKLEASLPDCVSTEKTFTEESLRTYEILLSGYLSFMNDSAMNTLAVESDKSYAGQVLEMLSESWGVEGREDLFGMLEYLLNEGHNAKWQACLSVATPEELFDDEMDEEDRHSMILCWQFANHFKDKLPETMMLGWDFGRAAMLIRWGFYTGMITEEESWSILDQIAEAMQDCFSSWKQFGLSYLFGSLFWMYPNDPEESTSARFYEGQEVLEGLLTNDGAWAAHPWIIAE